MSIIERERKKLLAVKPSLEDDRKARAFYRDILALGAEFGFTRYEMEQICDHRLLLLLDELLNERKR